MSRFARRQILAAALIAPLLGATTAFAQSDPAAAQVDVLDHALIEAMKGGAALGVQGRYRKLEPTIQRVFDLPTMTRFAVGPAWTKLPEADQRTLTNAFTRLSIANYAHNFDSFSGERFEIDPNVQTRGPDKIVQTKLIPTKGAPTSLMYRMRQSGGTWKVIDVYYGAISQLTTRRSDFAASIASGGAPALTAHINALVDKAMK